MLKTLINLIYKNKLNISPKWVSYSEYLDENKKITKKFWENSIENGLEDLIKLINDINIDDENKNEDNVKQIFKDSQIDNILFNFENDIPNTSNNDSLEDSIDNLI